MVTMVNVRVRVRVLPASVVQLSWTCWKVLQKQL